MIKSSKQYLVIDGEGLLRQAFHKFEKLHSSDGIPTGAIFGFIRSLKMYLYRFSPDDVYVVFDNGHSKYRTEILGSYKEHRKRIDVDYDSLQSQKKQIQSILSNLGIKYIYDKARKCNYEGDDFIAHLIINVIPKKSKVTIITADKDFNQLLRSTRIKIYNPIKDILIYETSCKAIFGYTASETVDYLSLLGDSSDDIPGYPGMGPVKTRRFLDKYGSIKKYLDGDEELRDDPKHVRMEEIYSKNKLLIDLKYFCQKYPLKLKDTPIVEPSKFSKKYLEKVANELDIQSFSEASLIKTFKDQYQKTYGK